MIYSLKTDETTPSNCFSDKSIFCLLSHLHVKPRTLQSSLKLFPQTQVQPSESQIVATFKRTAGHHSEKVHATWLK